MGSQSITARLTSSSQRGGLLIPSRSGQPRWLREATGDMHTDAALINDFVTTMRIAQRSEVTIGHRLKVLRRLIDFLHPLSILEADAAMLVRFQSTFAHRAPATVNIYSRHIRAFYSWAVAAGRLERDPAASIVVPHVRRGLPHPATDDMLRILFSCTTGSLRVAYVLAAFAGLRCGEISRLRANDLDMDSTVPTAIISGKGGKERTVPLLPPVVSELRSAGVSRHGWVIVTPRNLPYSPSRLSSASSEYLAELGLETTLHSLRHSFATWVARYTRDPLLVRDLLGHASVATSEIYMLTAVNDAHARLSEFNELAVSLLRPQLKLVQ
jgi:integrase